MLVVLAFVYGVPPGVEVLVLPVFLCWRSLPALGARDLLAALNVQYRDVCVAMPLLIQVWLFATPVIYPARS